MATTYSTSPPQLETKTFTYKKRNQVYEYSGSVDIKTQLPHGNGTLRYPNGTIYEGNLNQGRRHDMGSLYKKKQQQQPASRQRSSSTKSSSAPAVTSSNKVENELEWEIVGSWINNQSSPSFPFKINVPGVFEYFGCIALKTGSVDLVDIDDFSKERHGELFEIATNRMYFGEFKDNMMNGFGVQEFNTLDRYYGYHRDNKYHRKGTFFYKDGTVFQGRFYHGIRKGSGTLYLPNGDKLEGDWNGSDVKGTYTKGTVANCSMSALSLIKYEIDAYLTKNQDFSYMNRDNNNNQPICPDKWSGYATEREESWKVEKTFFISKYNQGTLASAAQFKSLVNDLLHGDKNCSRKLVASLVGFFKSSFDGSFALGTMRSKNVHSSMKRKNNAIFRAKEDTQSFIIFLSDLLWEYISNSFTFQFISDNSVGCPADRNPLSTSSNYMLLKNSPCFENFASGVESAQATETTKASLQEDLIGIISDYIHYHIYGTLFPLYQLAYQESDLFMAQKIEQLKDTKLKQLGVPVMFYSTDNEENPYHSAIKLLKELSLKKNVRSKIQVLSDLRINIMLELRNYREEYRKRECQLSGRQFIPEENWQPAADDVAGVYTYVFIKSNLQRYFAEFKYINEWKDKKLEEDPVSHMLTFFEGFLQFILEIHPNLKKPNGEYLSSFTLSESLKNSITTEIIQHRDEIIEPFYWLPSLLIFVSLNLESLDKSESKIIIPQDKKLYEEISKNMSVVQRVLARCKDIGFNVLQDTNNLFVEMTNIYPTHIYAELSLNLKRYIQFELLFIE